MAITTKKNALLLFCKPPIPGQVKTRLTKERGGKLSSEQAAEFFRRSVLDISDLGRLCLSDLRQSTGEDYDLIVSTTSEKSIAQLQQMFADDGFADGFIAGAAASSAGAAANYANFAGAAANSAGPAASSANSAGAAANSAYDPAVTAPAPTPHDMTFIVDRGASFDDHFDDAFQQIFALGYTNLVAIGGDMPTLPYTHIIDAFLWLDHLATLSPNGQAFVVAPCQQSGVSLVGQTATTAMDSQGVFYNHSGLPALDAYAEKLLASEIPNAYLQPVSDVDEDHDLAHCISCLGAIAEATRFQDKLYLPCRVLEWVDKNGIKASAPPNENHDPRNYIDL